MFLGRKIKASYLLISYKTEWNISHIDFDFGDTFVVTEIFFNDRFT
ncbi:hypothetical protein NBRC3257_1500 [Gluconobacter thailandicus NBRC 3257]|uniref:Transposase n=1 Tax=Gluconobacter thailandicus NBRC 3257 TaxID=1381097 RepID=A0ABQ0IWB8_GLUTH|nr:hypothetical protein NBRC3257_1500 [Gluconobacter thailandicus NBRC 3257]